MQIQMAIILYVSTSFFEDPSHCLIFGAKTHLKQGSSMVNIIQRKCCKSTVLYVFTKTFISMNTNQSWITKIYCKSVELSKKIKDDNKDS